MPAINVPRQGISYSFATARGPVDLMHRVARN